MTRRPEQEAYLAARMLELLTRIAVGRRKCKFCPAMLYFVRHADGAIVSYTDDGTNHWSNCPEAEAARRLQAILRQKGQRKLLDTGPIPE